MHRWTKKETCKKKRGTRKRGSMINDLIFLENVVLGDAKTRHEEKIFLVGIKEQRFELEIKRYEIHPEE